MSINKDNCGYFGRGLLFGALAGGLAGILFAPKSGKELRSDIRHKGEEAFGDAKRIYSETETKARHAIDDAKHRAEELRREADRQVDEAFHKAKRFLSKGKEPIVGEYAEETRVDA